MSKIIWNIIRFIVYFLIIFLVALLTFFDVGNIPVDKIPLGIMVIFLIIVSIVDRIIADKEKSEDSGKIKELLDSQEIMRNEQKKAVNIIENHKKEVSKLTVELENHGKSFDEWVNKKEGSIQLLNELIQRGIITESDAYSKFDGNKLYVIYCYANSLPTIWGYKGKKKMPPLKRKYPEFFVKNLRCYRLGFTSPVYITNSKRLPRKLHNPENLRNFCQSKLDPYLKEEWNKFIETLKDEQLKEYNIYKEMNYKQVLSLSLCIFRTSINNKNIGKIRRYIFPEDFSTLINEEIDLEKIGLPNEKKAEIKQFLNSCSIQFVLHGIDEKDISKISSLESSLKKYLNINNIFDYLERDSKKLKEFLLNNGFKDGEASKYTNKIIDKLSAYKKAMIELNISM